MSRPLRIMYPGAFYHVTCRGNERKEIFLEDKDRTLFLDKLLLSCNIFKARIRLQKKIENDRKTKMRFDELASKADDLSSLKI